MAEDSQQSPLKQPIEATDGPSESPVGRFFQFRREQDEVCIRGNYYHGDLTPQEAGEILTEELNDWLQTREASVDPRIWIPETLEELRAFEQDLHAHVHLENNILFPKARALANA